MEFILTVLVVILGFSVLRLWGRVGELEEKITYLDQSVTSSPVVPARTREELVSTVSSVTQFEPSESIASVPLRTVTFSDLATPPPPSSMTSVEQGASLYTPESYREIASAEPTEFFLVTWFKEQTLIKVGALIFFLGAVWFVSYAISLGLIPVAVRIFLGLLVAVLFYAAGIWRDTLAERVQYLVLTTLGTGIVMVTVFTAQFFFGLPLFPAPLALALIVASIAYTVFTSVRTTTEWLAIVSALAGLAAPFLVGSQADNQTMFLLYLFALAASFSTVVLFTHWRTLSIVLVLGVSWFELMLLASHKMDTGLLWIFIILFSALFLATTTVSLYRSTEPEPADIFLLVVVGALFTFGAHSLAVLPGLALFIAAFVLGGIGYGASNIGAPKRVIAVYICFSSAVWLIGTSLVFSGFTQLLALTIEITLAFLIVTDLRFSSRAIYLSLATFAIPVLSSIPVLFSGAWREGIWQLDCLATVGVAVALLGSMAWVLGRPLLRTEAWALPVAQVLGVVGFLYTLVLLARIAVSAFASSQVVTYILWMSFILVSLCYVLISRLPDSWITVVFGSTVLPVAASVQSLSSPAWHQMGVWHPDAIGVYGIIIFGGVLTGLLGTYYRLTKNIQYRMLTIIAGTLTIFYSFIVIVIFWNALFTQDIASVLVYTSYGLVLYGLSVFCWHLKSPAPAVYVVTGVGVVPALISLSSMNTDLWQGSIFQPQAAGLYVMTILAVVSALRFFQYQTSDETIRTRMRQFGTGLLIVAGLYSVALVWLIAHVLSASDSMAVTIALFVYTVAGLGLYVAGSSRGMLGIKYAGMTLLAVVVVRLGVVEVWVMDILWRIVTFLGIGLLFMLAALLEKKK
jgi:hypothetical protein